MLGTPSQVMGGLEGLNKIKFVGRDGVHPIIVKSVENEQL